MVTFGSFFVVPEMAAGWTTRGRTGLRFCCSNRVPVKNTARRNTS